MEKYVEKSLEIEDINLYDRQIIVPNVGVDGMKKLKKSKVVVVGAGGLGCPVIMYLSMSGIGNIVIIDHDRVDISNLQRQCLYTQNDIEKYKVDVAEKYIKSQNPSINVYVYKERLTYENCLNLLSGATLVVDCTDNISTRYIINDGCRILDIDFVAGSSLKWEGQIYVVPSNGNCYRCMFPEIKKETLNCNTSGIIAPICGLVGSLQSLEAIKLILDGPETNSKLIALNGYTSKSWNSKLKMKRCTVCTTRKRHPVSDIKCESEKMVFLAPEIKFEDIMKNLEDYLIIDIRTKIHFQMFHIKGSVNLKPEEIYEYIRNVYKPIVAVCYSGNTSKKEIKPIIQLGYKGYSLSGGISYVMSKYKDGQ